MSGSNGRINNLNGKTKWAAGAVVAVVSLTLAFVGGAVTAGRELGRIETKIEANRGAIDALTRALERTMDDRFRGRDWDRERKWIEGKFEKLETKTERCCP